MPTAREMFNLIRHAGPILAALRAIRTHDETEIDDKANNGDNARPPDGDDFNIIYSEAMHALRLIEQGE